MECVFAQCQNTRRGLSARDTDECADAWPRDTGGIRQLANLSGPSADQAESHQHEDLLGGHTFAQQGDTHHTASQRTGAPAAAPGR